MTSTILKRHVIFLFLFFYYVGLFFFHFFFSPVFMYVCLCATNYSLSRARVAYIYINVRMFCAGFFFLYLFFIHSCTLYDKLMSLLINRFSIHIILQIHDGQKNKTILVSRGNFLSRRIFLFITLMANEKNKMWKNYEMKK